MKDIQKLPACESPSAPRQSHRRPPHRILVVDEDNDLRRLSAEVMQRAGYEVDAANDGAAGWEAVYGNAYDLLITDHHLPTVSGVELLEKLRGARMTLPVIVTTGSLPRGEFTRYPWLQPAATLLKPYTNDELLEAVREVLRLTDGAHEQSSSPLGWQSQRSARGLQP